MIYLIYQTEDGARVSRSDGKTDCLTGVYTSVAVAKSLLNEISDREPGLQIVQPDVEKKKIKNYSSGNRAPKARG